MAGNSFLDTNWVSMRVLWILQNATEVAKEFNTEWESDFGKSFPVGSSVQVKLPQRWLITNGLGYQPQAINRLKNELDTCTLDPLELSDTKLIVLLSITWFWSLVYEALTENCPGTS